MITLSRMHIAIKDCHLPIRLTRLVTFGLSQFNHHELRPSDDDENSRSNLILTSFSLTLSCSMSATKRAQHSLVTNPSRLDVVDSSVCVACHIQTRKFIETVHR